MNNHCLLCSNGRINSNVMPSDLLLLTQHGFSVCVCARLINAECSSYRSAGFKLVSFTWMIVSSVSLPGSNSRLSSGISSPQDFTTARVHPAEQNIISCLIIITVCLFNSGRKTSVLLDMLPLGQMSFFQIYVDDIKMKSSFQF